MNATIALDAKLFWPNGSRHSFCEILMHIDKFLLGNEGACSILGLVSSEIGSLIKRIGHLRLMSPQNRIFFMNADRRDIYNACHAWQWRDANWAFEDKCPMNSYMNTSFWALPIATEIFDGERLYIVPIDADGARIIWVDQNSDDLVERIVSLIEYESAWTSLAHFIEEFVRKKSTRSDFSYPSV